jgi:hypothetical protein
MTNYLITECASVPCKKEQHCPIEYSPSVCHGSLVAAGMALQELGNIHVCFQQFFEEGNIIQI